MIRSPVSVLPLPLRSTTDEDFVICTETSDVVSTIVESLVVFPSSSSPLSETSDISPLPAGVDPTTLKNANQVENAINIIESRPVQEGIKSTKAGKVLDMEGQEIPQGSRIIGGKAVKETEKENNIKIENAILNKAKKLKIQSS